MWKRHYSKLNFNTWKYIHKNSFEYFLLNIGPLDWLSWIREGSWSEGEGPCLSLDQRQQQQQRVIGHTSEREGEQHGWQFSIIRRPEGMESWNLGMGKITGMIRKNILVFGHFLWYLHNFTLISSHFAGILLIFPLLLLKFWTGKFITGRKANYPGRRCHWERILMAKNFEK